MPSTADFLAQVLGPGQDGGWIETRAIPEPRVEGVFTRPFFWRTPTQAAGWLAGRGSIMNASTYGIFFGAARRVRVPDECWKGGKNDDVETCASLWSDLDWKSYQGGKEEAAERLRECRPAPGIIVCSGGGFHAYWMLRHPMTATLARGYNSRLALLLASDKAVVNPGRVMRLPGSLHRKNPENIRPVTIVGWNTSLRYEEHAFLTLPKPATPKGVPHPKLALSKGPRHEAEKALLHISNWLSTPSQEKHRRLFWASIKIGHYVGAGLLSECEAEVWLLSAVGRAGAEDMKLAEGTVRDGLKIGIREPFIMDKAS